MTDLETQQVPEKPSLANLSGVVTRQTHTSVIDIVRNSGRLWEADQLSDILAISRKHIYKLAKSGRIPCLRMGGAIRFDPEATAQWLEKRAA